MSALAPTLQAFLSEPVDYAELGLEVPGVWREVVEVVCIASRHPSSSRKPRSGSGGW
jgi:hypothetical protein